MTLSESDVIELNVDSLVGPSHHYAGLAFGNIASIQHAQQPANPKEAALQGLKKMRLLHQKGINQAFLPPLIRPNLALLHQLGFTGSAAKQIEQARKQDPNLLRACYSTSHMWLANAATVSSCLDTQDGKVHFTPANLISQLHRAQDTAAIGQQLRSLFHDERYFTHHDPLPACKTMADEGAANHNRLAPSHHQTGISIFVYGAAIFRSQAPVPQHYPARQTLEASQAIARQHQLTPATTFFVQQNPQAIDAGVFHNDVISVSNESVFILHEAAFVNQSDFLTALHEVATFPLHLELVPENRLSLEDAVRCYLFNSQLITLPDGGMLLLAPQECQDLAATRELIQEWIENPRLPIQAVEFIDVKQSMQNGGGPACLRLRVPLPANALSTVPDSYLISAEKLHQLEAWVQRYYRDRLTFEDLADPSFQIELAEALTTLDQLL